MVLRTVLAGLIVLGISAAAGAQEGLESIPLLPPSSTRTIEPDSGMPRPVLPGDSAWAGVVLILIGGMFLAAMTVGPMVRSPADAEPAEASDEHAPAHPEHGH